MDDVSWKKEYLEIERQDKKLKREWRVKLKGLINVSGLFKHLEGMMFWQPFGIVEIYHTDEKPDGYSSYQHVRIKDDEDKLLYLLQDENEIRGINHCCVWQSCGMMGDDFSGYLLFPLKDGKYFKINYSC